MCSKVEGVGMCNVSNILIISAWTDLKFKH